MIVVITCFQDGGAFLPLTHNLPVAMLPLMNQPLIEHHIEQFVDAGFDRFIVAAVDYPIPLGDCLGDGSRWGITIDLVVLRERCHEQELLDRISSKRSGSPVIIMPAEIVMDLDVKGLLAFQKTGNDQCVKVYRRNQLEMIGAFQSPTPTFRKKLLSWPDHTGIMVVAGDDVSDAAAVQYLCEGNFMKIDSPFALWSANMAGLARSFSCLEKQGLGTAESDIVVGHHFQRGTDSLLAGPALIGHHVRMNPRASLEGWNIVGDGVFIDKGAQVARSVIAGNTYIGLDISVEDSIVSGRLFYNLKIGQWVEVADSFILSDTRENEALSVLATLWERSVAACCLIALLPLILGAVLLRKTQGKRFFEIRTSMLTRASIIHPHGEDDARIDLLSFENWHSLLGRLPGLLNVLKGDVRLVGVRPLQPPLGPIYQEEWTRLREDAPCGLFTPVDAEGLNSGREEAKIVAENYYAATRSFPGDVKIFLLAGKELLLSSVTGAIKRILNWSQRGRKPKEL